MAQEFAYLIIGNPWAGKTLATALLADFIGVASGSTDSIVYEELAKERGVPRWSLEASAKESLRPDLVRVGNALCDQDPAALVSPLLARGARVIDGIRRRFELKAARQAARASGLIPVVVWVDRCSAVKDNTDVMRSDADYVISNRDTVGHLAKMIAEFAGEFSVPSVATMENPAIGMPRIDVDWEDGMPPSEKSDEPPSFEGFGNIGDD